MQIMDYTSNDGFLDVPLIIKERKKHELFPGLLPNIGAIRTIDFPLFERLGRVYLDNAATSQEPQSVIDRTHEYRKTHIRGSSHSENSAEAREAHEKFAETRKKVANFFNSGNYHVVFTSGTTGASNSIASRFPFEKGDMLLLTEMEHNSQILTARNYARKVGSEVAYVEASKPEGRLDLGHLESILYKRKKGKVLLNLVHVSNLTGVINPVKEIRKIMEETVDDRGFIYLDMAQSAGHMPINLDELDVDYGGASGHKMYGPTGIGLMFVNKRSEKVLDNKVSGGSAIRIVTRHDDVACRAPARFEPGTQNLEGAIELGYALDYLKEIGMERIERHDKELGRYFAGEAGKIEGVKLYGPSDFKDRGAVVSLNIGSSIRNYDIVERELDKRGISVRGGCFCSHIYTSKLLGVPITDFEKKAADMRGVPDGLIKLPGAVRFSFAFYNSLEDAYQAVEAVKDIAGNQTSLGI